MKNQALYIILSLVAIIIFAWYFNRHFIEPKVSVNNQATKATQTLVTENTTNDGEGKIVYFKQVGDLSQIIEQEILKSDQKVLYKEKVSDYKIKKVSNLSETKLLAFISSNGEKFRLESVNLTNSDRKVIKEAFVNIDKISLSPNGEYLSFVSFSNVEEDYGYSLNIVNLKTGEIKKSFTNEEEIKDFSWIANDSLILLYKKEEENLISKYNLANSINETLHKTKNDIQSLEVTGGQIYVNSNKTIYKLVESQLKASFSSETDILNFQISPDFLKAIIIDEKGKSYIIGSKQVSSGKLEINGFLIGWFK